MKSLLVCLDASAVGGCEDREFSKGSLRLWHCFRDGSYRMALSELTLNEPRGAPDAVQGRIEETGSANVVPLRGSDEADELADKYLGRGIVGPGSRADAHHVASATVAQADILVS